MAESAEKPQAGHGDFTDYESLLPRQDAPLEAEDVRQLNAQINDRLPDLLHRHPLGREMTEEEMADATRGGFHVTLDRDTFQKVFEACNLAGYDRVYVAIAHDDIGPEYFIEALTDTPEGMDIRFVRMSADETGGEPIAAVVAAQDPREETRPLTYSDAFFAQDVLQALEMTTSG